MWRSFSRRSEIAAQTNLFKICILDLGNRLLMLIMILYKLVLFFGLTFVGLRKGHH